jgi:hypothetical protein
MGRRRKNALEELNRKLAAFVNRKAR